MGKFTKDEIIAKAKELAKMIAETEEVDFFKRAEAQINENEKVREKIATIKEFTKTSSKFPTLRKRRSIKEVQKIKLRKSNKKLMKFQLFKNSNNHKEK